MDAPLLIEPGTSAAKPGPSEAEPGPFRNKAEPANLVPEPSHIRPKPCDSVQLLKRNRVTLNRSQASEFPRIPGSCLDEGTMYYAILSPVGLLYTKVYNSLFGLMTHSTLNA